MAYRYLLLCFLLCFLGAQSAESQSGLRRDAALSRELISLTRDTPMDQALRVIQTFSGRPIVDVQHLTDPVGVDIDRMPWPQAMALIANHNGLTLVEYANYYEISPLAGPVARELPQPDVTVDSREVNISAIFFEADRSAIRELGIDWGTLSGGRVDMKAAFRLTVARELNGVRSYHEHMGAA